MALSFLLIYEPLEIFGKKRDYWNHYISFCENYWGGPTSPYGVYFGNEYNNFRRLLANYLEVEEKKIEDCYFMKDEKGRYYISLHKPPVDTYILSCENHIPLHWFFAFDASEKKSFSTRLDFRRIHYVSELKNSVQRISRANRLFSNFNQVTGGKISPQLEERFINLKNGLFELQEWIANFHGDGFIVLDYGELCSLAEPEFINKENSVPEMNRALDFLESGDHSGFCQALLKVSLRWDDLRKKISSRIPASDTFQ